MIEKNSDIVYLTNKEWKKAIHDFVCKKDSVVLFSSGAYSDYQIICVCVAKKDITQQNIIDTLGYYRKKHKYDVYGFANHLIGIGLFEEIYHKELFFGEYGEIPKKGSWESWFGMSIRHI